MSYTQWVSNGTNVSYVPKEKDTGEVITPFSTTASGGVPNSSYAPSTYVLAASGAWIPQTVGTSSSEVRRPTAYTLITSNGSPYFEATDTSLVYDSDTNHLTTNGRFELQGLSAQNDASFKFSSFQTKAQTWTSATLNISRNYASTRWTSGTEARYYLSTDGGTNWTLLLTDDYDNDPVTVTIFSHTLATSNPSSLSNYQVKVEIDAFSSGALGSVGVLDLQLYDIWIEGIYTVSGGSGTVTSITTTGANGVTISGGSTQTITTSGTFALALGNITPTSISTGTGSFSGDVEFAASIKSPNGSNSPVTIVPDGTGDLHVNADSLRLGDNNANATIATNGTGDLILTTHEGSTTEGVIRLYDGANGNITLTPYGTGQVQVGSDQVVTLTASQTLTNKTLSSNSVWNGNVIGSAYGGAGTINGILKANGSGTVSAASAGTDYVTSVSVTSPVSNTGTTANPTIALASGYGDTQNPYGSKTANYFLASPNGTAGSPTFRAIVAADIPTLNQNTTGNAATASALQTARNINGVSFNGTADITVTAAANTLTGTTLASGVTASSLTSVGTLTGLTVTRTTSGDTGTFTNTSTTNQSANVNAVSDNSTAISLRVFGSAAGSYGMLAANSTALYTTATSLNLCADNASGVIKFSTGSSVPERMRLDSSGNLGLGTASPTAKLDIAVSSTMGTYGPGTLNLKLRNTNTAETNSGALELLGHTGNASSPFPQGTISAEKQTSAGDGNYGSKLHLWTTSGGSGGEANSGQYRRLTIDSSGNVGIGTVSPSAKLTVNSGANRQIYIGQNTSNTNYNAISLNGSLSDSGLMGLAGGGTGDETLYVMSQGNMVFRTVGTNERMRIDSSGNVGIGVSSTTFRLDVQGSSSGYLEAIRFKNTNSAGYLTTSWTVGSAEATIRYAPGSFFKIGPDSGDTTSPIVFATNNGTERMRITSTEVKATVPFIGNSGTKGFGAITTTTSTSTPTGGSSGDHYYIY